MLERQKYRQDGCSFDEILSMTTTPDRVDVIDHYVQESAMQNTDRQMFLLASSVALPWFAALSLAAFKMATVTVATGAAVTVCDPVFVAEMPKARASC